MSNQVCSDDGTAFGPCVCMGGSDDGGGELGSGDGSSSEPDGAGGDGQTGVDGQLGQPDGDMAADGQDMGADGQDLPDTGEPDADMGPDVQTGEPDAGPDVANPPLDASTDDTGVKDAGGPPLNLITGGVDSGLWGVTAGNATVSINGQTLCLNMPGGGTYLLGWPMDTAAGADLVGGASYDFTFTSWSNPSGAQLSAKIGEDVWPFGVDFQAMTVTLSGAHKAYGWTFVEPAGGDPHAGIAFTITASTNGPQTACFQGISLVQQ
jgi:hypothetical protein